MPQRAMADTDRKNMKVIHKREDRRWRKKILERPDMEVVMLLSFHGHTQSNNQPINDFCRLVSLMGATHFFHTVSLNDNPRTRL